MAVSSVTYNKPILPRTTDTSDLGSNRASVYSGKGLSFDGVNDEVIISNFSVTRSTRSLSYYFRTSISSNERVWQINDGGNYFNSTVLNGKINTFDGVNGINTIDTFNDNKWHHVVITYNGNNDVVIYVDGVSREVDSTSFTVHNIINANLSIASANGSQFYSGNISNVRLFNVSLTAAQVKELYENPEQVVPTGVSQTSLVLHLPMTEGNGSYLYNANQGALGTELISNGGFDETCQKWGTTDSNDVEIVNGKAIWTNAPLSGSFVKQPLDLEIGKFYRVSFDYTSTAFNIFVNLGDTQQAVPLGNGRASFDMYYGSGDSSLSFQHGYLSASSATVDNVSVKEVVPNYYKGTITGATWVSGLPEPLPQTALMDWNKYQYWTGSQMATIGSSTVTTVKHTFHARIRLDALNSDTNLGSMIFMNYAATGTIFSVTYNGKVQLRPHCSTNGSVNLVSGSVLNLGEVYDVVGVIDGTTAKIYVNGILDTSASHIQTTSPQGGGVIGSWSSTNLNTAFDGIIHEVSYFDRGLTGEEIGGLYQGTITPESLDGCIHRWTNLSNWQDQKGSTNATLTGTPEYVLVEEGHTSGIDAYKSDISNPRASGAYNFDGASWAEVDDNASLDITDAITLECWFYWNNITSKGIFGRWHQDSNNRNYLLWKSSDTRVDFYINGSTVAQYYSLNATKGWTHIVGVYDRNTAKIYIDGVDVASSSHSLAITTSTMPLEIGRNFTTVNQAINSQLAQPRIYNYALTAEQVADNYNQKVSTFGGTKATSEMDAYIARTVAAGATVEAHSCVINYLTELDKK